MKILSIILTITLTLTVSLFSQGKTFTKGSKVDVFQKDKYYKATILESGTCYLVTYDDGSSDVQSKASMAPSGNQDSIGNGVAGKPGEAVEVLWLDGNWYTGTISNSVTCYKVNYTGWPKEHDSWTANSNVFPFDSKVKGDTSQNAQSNSYTSQFKGDTGQKRNFTVGYAADGSYTDDAGNKIPADKVRQCQSTSDEYKCRSTSQCRYDFSKKVCIPGGP